MIAIDVTALDRLVAARLISGASETTQTLTPDAVAVAVRAAGASGLCLNLHDADAWQRLLRWREVASQLRLPIVAVGVELNVRRPEPDPRVVTLLTGHGLDEGTLLQVSLSSDQSQDVPSAPRADAPAIALLRQLLDLAGPRTRIALQPNSQKWLARVQDAVRLGMRINRPGLGIAIDTRTISVTQDELEPTLHLALPRLWNIIVSSGARSHVNPIDHASAAALYAGARRLGFDGPLTIDCDGMDGSTEITESLRRSIGL